MRSFTCVSVVVYVARKLHPCPSYSRRRDRINLVLWRSLDKGGGVAAVMIAAAALFGVELADISLRDISGLETAIMIAI